jgi:hypothetical protein
MKCSARIPEHNKKFEKMKHNSKRLLDLEGLSRYLEDSETDRTGEN